MGSDVLTGGELHTRMELFMKTFIIFYEVNIPTMKETKTL